MLYVYSLVRLVNIHTQVPLAITFSVTYETRFPSDTYNVLCIQNIKKNADEQMDSGINFTPKPLKYQVLLHERSSSLKMSV